MRRPQRHNPGSERAGEFDVRTARSTAVGMLGAFIISGVLLGARPVQCRGQAGPEVRPVMVRDEELQIPEYRLKAAFLAKFVKFVQWPKGTFERKKEIVFAVVGPDPLGKYLDQYAGKRINGLVVRVVRWKTPKDIGHCHVLFVASDLAPHVGEIVTAVGKRPILTVGDAAGMAKTGTVISLFLRNKRVAFEVNTLAAKRSGLRISSKLLRLAARVYGGEKK